MHPVFDTLNLKREVEDGAFYIGNRGEYFFYYKKDYKNQKPCIDKNRLGSVMLNRKFLTGLYRGKPEDKKRVFGGIRETRQHLIFNLINPRKIVINTAPMKKKKNQRGAESSGGKNGI